MFPPTIVPPLDVLEGGQPGSRPCRKISMVDQLTFERFKKAFSHCIVPAIAFSAHTLYHRQALQLMPEFSAGVLHSTIRMEEHSVAYFPILSAIRHAATLVSVALRLSLKAQPTTFRSAKSRTAVKYSQPSPVGTYVISETHFWPGLSAVNSLFSKFSATG